MENVFCTLSPEELESQVTLPASGLAPLSDDPAELLPEGTEVGCWRLLAPLKTARQSTLYLAGRDGKADTVIKVYSRDQTPRAGLLRRLSLLQEPALAPLLGSGLVQGRPFEAFPLYSEGTLENEILSEKTILQVVLPQMVQALSSLHQARLLHNDIKPGNVFWKKRGEEIALGDFDCLSEDRGPLSVGGTPAYMAPEVLASDGRDRSPASDYCALGLTLIALLTGTSPLAGKSKKEMLRIWQQGELCPRTLSPELAVLLQGLTRFDARTRLDWAGVQRWLRNQTGEKTSAGWRPTPKNTPAERRMPLRFRKQLLLEIPELVDVCGKDWDYAAFFLQQNQMTNFLIQFDPAYHDLCRQCATMFDSDEGLFRLLITLQPRRDFYWLGRHYSGLEQFAEEAAREQDRSTRSPYVRFIRGEMLELYLRQNQADEKQCAFAARLRETARIDPGLALTQLLVSMQTEPVLPWKGASFSNLEELALWLLAHREDLDAEIAELCASERFKAWLDFIQCGRFLLAIRCIEKEDAK